LALTTDSDLRHESEVEFTLVAGQSEALIAFPIGATDSAKFWSRIEFWIKDRDSRSIFSQLLFRHRVVPSFERESLATSFDGDQKVPATAKLDDTEPQGGSSASGGHSVRLSYQMDGGWRFCRLIPNDAIRANALSFKQDERLWNPVMFRLWLHGDGKGCQARVRFKDKTGQVFQPDGPKIDWKGWRYVTLPMRSTEEKPLAHWGGANDGVIHYPIEWDSIFILDNVSREPVEGEIYLSAPTLIY
jgi:hypothetical protein